MNPTPRRRPATPDLMTRRDRRALARMGVIEWTPREAPPMDPRGPRRSRRATRLAALYRDLTNRPRFRAPRATPTDLPIPPLGRGRDRTPEQITAWLDRRQAASLRKAGRMSRRQRMELLRTGQPQATRSDLRSLLHSIARDRRDGVS